MLLRALFYLAFNVKAIFCILSISFARVKGEYVMKNLKILVAILLANFMMLFAFGCVAPTYYVVSEEDCVKIIVDKDYMDLGDNVRLVDYMQALKQDGFFDFTIVDGMVTSINGKENATDFTSCWMLYTDDADMSNTSWGTIELDGKTYASAISGAEDLIIKDGTTYVWTYVTF